MNEEQIRNINTLLDGIEEDKKELLQIYKNIDWKIRDIREILAGDKKDEF